MEALASGLPVITTNSPPMNEFVNEVNGKLIKVKKLITRPDGYYWPLSIVDETDLAGKMNYYIDNKKDLDYLSKKARESAENNLNVYKNFSKLNDIFELVKLLNILTKKEIENKIKTNENKELKKAAYYVFKKIAPDFLKNMVIEYYITHKNKI
jgi:glycosyltransferase involved in cell wall biosynthesis